MSSADPPKSLNMTLPIDGFMLAVAIGIYGQKPCANRIFTTCGKHITNKFDICETTLSCLWFWILIASTGSQCHLCGPFSSARIGDHIPERRYCIRFIYYITAEHTPCKQSS